MPQVKLPYMMGLKLRMYPDHRQKAILWKNINAARFIYNQLLANSYTDSAIKRNRLDQKYPIPKDYWQYKQPKKAGKKPKLIKKSTIRPSGLARITVKRYPWLGDSDLDSDMFTNTQIHYRNAWKHYRQIHSAGIPKFKKKRAAQYSLTAPLTITIVWESRSMAACLHFITVQLSLLIIAISLCLKWEPLKLNYTVSYRPIGW